MIYLLGGGKGFINDVGEEFKSTLKDTNSIVFIPTSPEDMDKCEKYKKINLEWFREIGIKFDKVKLINSQDNIEIAKNKITESEVVFLMGGNPISQLKFILDKELDKNLKEHKGIIIGVSAGALSICKKCIITKDEDFSENIVLDGINLTNGINVEVHYTNDHDDDIYEIIKEQKLTEIYGIPEDCALKLENGTMKFIGRKKLYVLKQDFKEEIEI
ncbi:Type 1 glutamine amidotransferase-like domain-containing protein [Haloimpatiens sp. FM7330]|uniref:Type 1 glutamine amidotransferase-like domain-containing protein n=1 Tax=Haloimpatiens sp. FM7330 TaxID=3298610 RepID=UPI0036292685